MFFVEPLRDAARPHRARAQGDAAVLCALGPRVCFRANVWNIGAEGQFLLGAIAAAASRCTSRRTGRAPRGACRRWSSRASLGGMAVGGDRRAAARPLQRERDPGEPDAGVRRASSCSTIWCSARGRTRTASTSRRRRRSPRRRSCRDRAGAARLHIGFAIMLVLAGLFWAVHVPHLPRLPAPGRRARARGGALRRVLVADGAVDRAAGLGRHGGSRGRDGGGRPARSAHAARVHRLRLYRDHRGLRRPAASARLLLRQHADVACS